MRAFIGGFLASLVCCVAICATMVCTFAQTPAGWQTYRSAEYGFAIDYPKEITSFESNPDPQLMRGSYIPICDGTTVACFEYNGNEGEGTNLESAGLSVNVLRDLRRKEDCDTIDGGSPPATAETINRTNFHYAETGSAGLGNSKGGPAYRAFYQNVCFEVSVGIAESSADDGEPGSPKPFDSTRIEKMLIEMVHTFRFTGDVGDGPGWKVYNDGECGGSYEYPDSDTVIVDVAYPQAGYNSNDITCSQHFSDHGRNYTVATKVNLPSENQFEEWLRLSGYPGLPAARVVMCSKSWTKYYAEPYYYVFGEGKGVILSVSDSRHVVISAQADRVFAHLLRTHKMN
ncbi:MAG: hypothetical protein WB460_21700 [Candidatus Acidiferrales bacterium]